jgi:flavin-dependent dehydrogenase
MIDVLVAGGGPVGLATAIRCALAGLSVTVAEPRGRTVLHAALAGCAAALGIPVLPARVTAFEQQASHVTAAGIEARYLVAADGLHSTIRRLLERSSPRRPAAPRYGLRRHYRIAPWTDLVEVYLTAKAEAYVTPVSADVVGTALLLPRPGGNDFEARLSAFPALSRRLSGAACASDVRGAGPMRQDVRRRVHGRVLLVGDASGYLDALTGEGLGVGLAQAEALLASRLVPAAQYAPWLFSTAVNHVAQA